MHELALCSAIAGTVRDHAAGREVRTVTVKIGHLRQVVPDTLAFCWDLTVEGTDLDGALLEVDDVAAVIRCRDCAAETTLDDPLLLCGSCGGARIEVVHGEELSVESIDIVQEVG